MNRSLSIAAGLALVATTLAFAAQGASEPVRSAPVYFVTAEGDVAHLWVREGATLRVVGHGACRNCPHADGHVHKEGDGHEHARAGAKQ